MKKLFMQIYNFLTKHARITLFIFYFEFSSETAGFGRQVSSSLTVLMRTSINGLSLRSVATWAILSMMSSPLTVSPKTV